MWVSPVGLPDVDRLRVVDTVLFCHVVQEVKEESDSNRRRTLCAEDGHKHIVDKLLQRPLEEDGQVEDECVRPSVRQRHLPASHLHGQQSGQVDLRYGLGSLPVPHAALSVFWDVGIFTALHKVPQTKTLFLLTLKHGGFYGNHTDAVCLLLLVVWTQSFSLVRLERCHFSLQLIVFQRKVLDLLSRQRHLWLFWVCSASYSS